MGVTDNQNTNSRTKKLAILLTTLVLTTILYPVLVMYLIYYAKGIFSISIPLILYFVSSFILVFLFIFQIRLKDAKQPSLPENTE